MQGTDAGALVGREDGELDALGRQQIEHAAVDGGLRQPHALGAAAEAVLEIGDAPADLGESVAPAGQRHDDVVVNLGDGGAVTAVAQGAGAVRVQDHAIGAGGTVGEPLEQGGAEVEAHARVVINDAHDFVLAVGDARGAVRRVALRGDALVPVMPGRGGFLHFDRLQPGILAWRLVEVAMHADVAVGGRLRRLGGFRGGTFHHGRYKGNARGKIAQHSRGN